MSYPTPEQVRAWMKNHVCIPRDGIPQSFIEQLTQAAESKGTNRKEKQHGEV